MMSVRARAASRGTCGAPSIRSQSWFISPPLWFDLLGGITTFGLFVALLSSVGIDYILVVLAVPHIRLYVLRIYWTLRVCL